MGFPHTAAVEAVKQGKIQRNSLRILAPLENKPQILFQHAFSRGLSYAHTFVAPATDPVRRWRLEETRNGETIALQLDQIYTDTPTPASFCEKQTGRNGVSKTCWDGRALWGVLQSGRRIRRKSVFIYPIRRRPGRRKRRLVGVNVVDAEFHSRGSRR